MRFKVAWAAVLCSIPLIIFSVMPQSGTDCSGSALCIKGKITGIVDGDTLDVGQDRVRLSLVDAPEMDQIGGTESRRFVEETCPAGSDVLVDEDDGQVGRSYDRVIAKVYCQGIVLNEEIIERGHGKIYGTFCSKSEFGNEDWATRNGC